eukprot:5845008-Karenia_brevis.AAC.1
MRETPVVPDDQVRDFEQFLQSLAPTNVSFTLQMTKDEFLALDEPDLVQSSVQTIDDIGKSVHKM